MTQNWTVNTLSAVVDAELDELPEDMRARFVRIALLVEEFGPFKVGMPHVRSLGTKLWEIRASGRDGIARGIYVVTKGQKVVVVHVFIKKTQQTPANAIRTAIKRAKDANLL